MAMIRLAILGLLGVLVFTPASQAAPTELEAKGKALAEANCAKCHAIGKEGESKLPLAPPFRDLKDKYPLENLEEALAEGIVTSHPQMPVFQMEPPQIEAFIEYLSSLNE